MTAPSRRQWVQPVWTALDKTTGHRSEKHFQSENLPAFYRYEADVKRFHPTAEIVRAWVVVTLDDPRAALRAAKGGGK